MKIYALFIRMPFAANPPDFFEEPAVMVSGESGWFFLKSHSLMQSGYCDNTGRRLPHWHWVSFGT